MAGHPAHPAAQCPTTRPPARPPAQTCQRQAVTAAVARHSGLGSALFAACLCFSVIVMYDAMGVRRHAGLQAEVINVVVTDLMDGDHPISQRKLKQVLAGAALGLAVACAWAAP